MARRKGGTKRRWVALDSETADLSAKYDPLTPMHCFSLAERVNGEVITSCYEWNDKNKKLLEDLNNDDSVRFIIHNAAFDIPVFRLRGVNIKQGKYLDSMLLAYCLQPMTGQEHYSLKEVGEFIGEAKIDYRQALIEAGLLSPNAPKNYEYRLTYNPVMDKYARQDAKVTLLWAEYLLHHLLQDEALQSCYFDLELPYVEAIIQMEQGSYVDRPFLENMKAKLEYEIPVLESKVLSIVPYAPRVSWDETEKKYIARVQKFSASHNGITYKKELTALGKSIQAKKRPFDPDDPGAYYRLTWEHCELVPFEPSTDQLPWLLMERYGWIPKKFTPNKRPAIGADVLDELHLDKLEGELPKLVNELLDKKKLYKTYVCALLEASARDSFVRGSFIQIGGTVTTRLASRKPNLQNLDPRVKPAFQAPPGHILAVADLDAIEVAVLAYFLEVLFGDSRMADLIRSGISPHTSNAELWGVPRPVAKTTLFGIVYGQTEKGLAEKLNVALAVAKGILDGIFSAMPSLVDLKKWVFKMATKKRDIDWLDLTTGEVANRGWLTTLLGHRVYYPDVLLTNPRLAFKVQRAERQLGNALIQTSAGEIFKYLSLQVKEYLFNLRQDLRLVFAVHDEGGTYIPLELATEKVRKDLTACMCSNDLLSDGDTYVPVTAEFLYGFNWHEAKSGNICDLEMRDRWIDWQVKHPDQYAEIYGHDC